MKLKMILQVICLTVRIFFAAWSKKRLKRHTLKLENRIAAIKGAEAEK